MKKSVISVILAVVLCVTFAVTLVGCGTKYDSKTTIVIEPFGAAGYGLDWLQDLADEWTAANKDSGYSILIKKNSTNLAGTQLSQMKSGSTDTDVYFGSTTDYQSGFYQDYFEDLTDMLSVKPDGDNGLTIKDKIIDYDSWKQLSSKWVYDEATNSYSLQGCYMLPHSRTLTGLVYDHDYFVEQNLLTYAENTDEVKAELTAQGITYSVNNKKLVFVSSTGTTNFTQGDYILSAGKDGKYGTYDDGQPQTMAEFDTLVNKIKGIGMPFIASSSNGLDYIQYIADAYFIQYAGLDAFSAVVSYDSNGNEIDLYDGTKTAITMANGYKAYQASGVSEMLDFLDKYFIDNKNCAYESTVDGVQRAFVTGGTGQASAKFYGMAVDGDWFEKEAASTMDTANKYSDKPRGYGEVDYRFMLLPNIDGQKGIDGEGNGSVITGIEGGGILVRKQSDAKKLQAIKSFIAYTLTDKALSETTQKCGLMRNYKYSLSAEQLADMTPFQRTCYSIYNDTENVKTITQRIDRCKNPASWAGQTKYESLFPVGTFNTAIEAMKSGTSKSDCLKSIRGIYGESSWANLIANVNKVLPKK